MIMKESSEMYKRKMKQALVSGLVGTLLIVYFMEMVPFPVYDFLETYPILEYMGWAIAIIASYILYPYVKYYVWFFKIDYSSYKSIISCIKEHNCNYVYVYLDDYKYNGSIYTDGTKVVCVTKNEAFNTVYSEEICISRKWLKKESIEETLVHIINAFPAKFTKKNMSIKENMIMSNELYKIYKKREAEIAKFEKIRKESEQKRQRELEFSSDIPL